MLAYSESGARVVGLERIRGGIYLNGAMTVFVAVIVLEERMHCLSPVLVGATHAVDRHGSRKPAQECQAGEQP
jgi:hypothetical protein